MVEGSIEFERDSLASYLERIESEAEMAPALDTLADLQFAHATHIPFENLDIHLGRPIRLDVSSLKRKLIAEQRGGYCFEQNTLLAAVLEHIGFRLTRLAARVVAGDARITARAHMILAVEADDQRWLVDVGFGAGTPLRPVLMRDGATASCGGWTYRLVREDALWILQSRGLNQDFSDLYTFTEEPHYPIDYEVANHYTSTHPTSGFVRTITAQRPSPERQLILRGRELTERWPDGRSETTTIHADDLLPLLQETFGLRLDEGTRFTFEE